MRKGETEAQSPRQAADRTSQPSSGAYCVQRAAGLAGSVCSHRSSPSSPSPVPSPAPPRRSSLQPGIPAGRWRRVLPRASASWGEGVRIGSGVVSPGLWHPRVLVPKWTHSDSAPLHPCLSGRVEESPREMLSGGGVLPQSLLV